MARFDFEGEHSDELSFSEGDVIQLKAYVGQDWARGQMGTAIGIFPLNFVEVIEDLPPPSRQPGDTPEAATPAQVSRIYVNSQPWQFCRPTRRTGSPVCFTSSSIPCSLCRPLRPAWSGRWLCTTLLVIQEETCPFSGEITFWSASILILSGAAVASAAERAFSPGLLLRAQVGCSPRPAKEVTEIYEILKKKIKFKDTFLSCTPNVRSPLV